MPPVVCIIGRPKSGKTTLITNLIPELKRRGYRVATIKHTTHEFETDTPGKDSWKHAQAGSECTVLSSEKKVTLVRRTNHDLDPSELARLITDDFDVILAEGFKGSSEPKIEVYRREAGELLEGVSGRIAVVTDESGDIGLPCFAFDEVAGIADIIEKTVLGKVRRESISIFAEGKPLPLKPFVEVLYRKLVMDMVSPLKGVKEPKRVDVSVKRR